MFCAARGKAALEKTVYRGLCFIELPARRPKKRKISWNVGSIVYARFNWQGVLIIESEDGSKTLGKYWRPISRKA